MELLSLYTSSPYFWFFFAALFLGACISKITRPVRARDDRDRENKTTRKWIIVCINLSVAILFVLAGLFVPGLDKFTESTGFLFSYFFILLAYFFIAFRFKKAIGLPSVMVIVLLAVFALLFLQSITAFTGETEIAEVKVHYAGDNEMTLEVVRKGAPPEMVKMDGEYFAPVVEIVIFDDFLVFFGYKTWYRFIGLTSFAYEKNEDGLYTYRQQNTDYYFENPLGISNWLYKFMRENQNVIPGIKTVQVEIDPFKVFEESGLEPEKFRTYSIRIQNDGGIQIVEI
jgi:hypothetical protein